ncbi:hypothetical protein SNE40_014003 [Patella caerulea]
MASLTKYMLKLPSAFRTYVNFNSFSSLCLRQSFIIGYSPCQNAVNYSDGKNNILSYQPESFQTNNTNSSIGRAEMFHTNLVKRYYSSNSYSDEFNTPSPYKKPGPRNYGYKTKTFTEGLLPRSEEEKKFLQKYKPKDSWNRRRALFGQNDYIDILGDEGIHPVNLIKGPSWLVGFNGNEYQRLSRRMKFEREELKHFSPDKYHNIKKRMFYLFKKYNQRRVSRWK